MILPEKNHSVILKLFSDSVLIRSDSFSHKYLLEIISKYIFIFPRALNEHNLIFLVLANNVLIFKL